jgi:hypothetical protein
MSNSVDQNPWQNQPTNGPRFGNAYESEPINSPYGNTYGQTTMPQPGVSSSGYNNAWSHKESNKTEYLNDGTNMQYIPTYPPPQQNSSPYDTSAYSPMPAKQDAYQYSGTAYGNQPQPTGSAYSSVPVVDNPTKPVGPTNQSTTMVTAGPKPWNGEIYHRPSISRLCLRFIILLAGIGHLGFAAGAQPVKYTMYI